MHDQKRWALTSYILGRDLDLFDDCDNRDTITGKVVHTSPMLSLKKCYTDAEVSAWIYACQKAAIQIGKVHPSFTLSHKLDGVALEAVYRNGALQSLSTRGNGVEGESILHHREWICGIPSTVYITPASTSDIHSIRGEAVLIGPVSALNREMRDVEEGFVDYANARSAVSGLLQRDQLPDIRFKDAELQFVIYSMDPEIDPSSPLLRFVTEKRISAPPEQAISDILDTCHELASAGVRQEFPIDTDGVVIAVTDLDIRAVMGQTSKYPNWAIAYKFTPEGAFTSIYNIRSQVGKSGVITPVADIRPVVIGGTVITRATLHNWDRVSQLGICIHDTVYVERAGDVIPQITKVIPGEELQRYAWTPPTECPSCAGSVTFTQSGICMCVSAMACVYDCPDAAVATITHFSSRDALNIDGLGEESVRALHATGIVCDIADIFAIPNVPGDCRRTPGFGPKKIERLVAGIQRASVSSMDRVIFGLSIPGVGQQTAKQLARYIVKKNMTMWAFFKGLSYGAEDFYMKALCAIDSVGEDTARSIITYARSPRHQDILAKMSQYITISASAVPNSVIGVADKRFVISGTFPLSRQQMVEIIENAGGIVGPSVSKTTDYLVVGDDPGSSKVKAAEKHGTKKLTFLEFQQLVH